MVLPIAVLEAVQLQVLDAAWQQSLDRAVPNACTRTFFVGEIFYIRKRFMTSSDLVLTCKTT